MKLFSGDSKGNIGLTDINYENSTCTGNILFKIEMGIEQLSYGNKILAVSSSDNCYVCNFKENTSLIKVGSKQRNPPGPFGCALRKSEQSQFEDIVLCSRPGRKIWSANLEGVVQFSYIHKNFPEEAKIELVDGHIFREVVQDKISFGKLILMDNSILLSYSSHSIVIIDISDQKVLGFIKDIEKIVDVSVDLDTKQIFILENDRQIRCLSIDCPRFGENVQSVKNTHIPLPDNFNLDTLADLVPNNLSIQNLTKIGESVVSKFSTFANPSIVVGEKNVPAGENVMDMPSESPVSD